MAVIRNFTRKSPPGVVLAVFLAVFMTDIAWANPPLILADTASIEINGTSTAKDWSCSVSPRLELLQDGRLPDTLPLNFTGTISAEVRVTSLVQNIDCGDKTMNKHLRNALKWEEFPEIIFQMKEAVINRVIARVLGDLSIAGVTRPVELQAKLERTAQEGANVSGNVEINMKDYNITPPSLMLGMLKVDPKISLNFINVVVRSSNANLARR